MISQREIDEMIGALRRAPLTLPGGMTIARSTISDADCRALLQAKARPTHRSTVQLTGPAIRAIIDLIEQADRAATLIEKLTEPTAYYCEELDPDQHMAGDLALEQMIDGAVQGGTIDDSDLDWPFPIEAWRRLPDRWVAVLEDGKPHFYETREAAMAALLAIPESAGGRGA